jgi:hypothetical protein
MYVCWVDEPVRYASVHSLQPAGEAPSVPAGYQTDTRHSRGELWDTGGPTGETGTNSCLTAPLPSHANTTEQLHTSPPGYYTVQIAIIYIDTPLLVIQQYLTLITSLLIQILAELRRVLEYSALWHISGVVICYVFHRILSHHGKVFVKCKGISYRVHLIKCDSHTVIFYTIQP